MARSKSNKPKEDPVARLRRRYATYDPDKEGYGNPAQWRAAWEQTMGHEEAMRVLGLEDPLAILGFDTLPTLAELKKRYRQLMMKHNPNTSTASRGEASEVDPELTRKIIAAYSELKDKAV